MLVEQKEAAVSRGLLEVESWVFSLAARDLVVVLVVVVLGGAMGLWAIGLALMEGGGVGVSRGHGGMLWKKANKRGRWVFFGGCGR